MENKKRKPVRVLLWLMVLILAISPSMIPTGNGTALAAGSYSVFLPEVAASNPPMISPSLKPGDALILAAGDIASCGMGQDALTAALIESIPTATVLTLGDNAYPDGTPLNFTNCYAPTWGQFLARTRPSPGNHDYLTTGAAGYFSFFGSLAGNPADGYYSYNLGSWHIISLNSNCHFIGTCVAGSPEEQWLRADLAAHPSLCTLAYWHHPYFSDGQEGSSPWMQYIWQALYDYGVDVVLNGHDHVYERFAPQDVKGNLDPAKGITEFVVGTGGKGLVPFQPTILPNSLVRNDTSFGVLEMVLHPTGYSWQFISVTGSFTDSGSAQCH